MYIPTVLQFTFVLLATNTSSSLPGLDQSCTDMDDPAYAAGAWLYATECGQHQYTCCNFLAAQLHLPQRAGQGAEWQNRSPSATVHKALHQQDELSRENMLHGLTTLHAQIMAAIHMRLQHNFMSRAAEA